MDNSFPKNNLTNEVFAYWIPRLVADGVDINDILSVHSVATNWPEWSKAWSEIGNRYYLLAKEMQSEGHDISAGETLIRASLAYHCSQIVAFHSQEDKKAMQALKAKTYQKAAPLLAPPLERIEVSFKNHKIPGYLRLPRSLENLAACVLLVPGLDSTKEDFHTIGNICVKRGLACFSFDGPGQGEFRQHLPLAEGYEECIQAIFDAISSHPKIDPLRIGTLGRSLGGYFVMRAAAKNPQIAATVVFGGAFDLEDFSTMPKMIRDGFCYATGGKTDSEARTLMGASSLIDCIDKVKKPVLIVHGKLDAIFNWKQAIKLSNSLPGVSTLVMDDNGVHCCHNNAFQYRTKMIDWLANVLKKDQGL